MNEQVNRERPTCQKCGKPVESFKVGKDFRRRNLCFFESACHGEVERFEYWPVSLEAAIFEPAHAFPAERPPAGTMLDEAPQQERNLPTVKNELFTMPEWRRLDRIQHFGISIRLLEGNAEELRKLLSFLTSDPRSMQMSDVRHRAELDKTFEEVLRLLHNFVASALTLVDHTRVVHRELYEGTASFPEYQAEVDLVFVKDPVQFVQKLRHLAQHVRLPNISLTLETKLGTGMSRRLVLRKDDLLQFNGWNAPAKEYLASAPETIDLSELVTAYASAIRAFYGWMEARQREIHARDVQEVEKKQAEGRALLAQEMPHLLNTGLMIWGQGVGSLQDIFAFGFSPADWVELSKYDGNLTEWTDAALALTEKRFGLLPAELNARIREAARSGR